MIDRPSDNPLRVAAYATAAVLAVYAVLALLA